MPLWQKKPFIIQVKKGQTIKFCACGLSKNGPYCDGSHARENTGKTPYVITFDEDKTIAACGCQTSKNRPYCDGSHKKLPQDSEVN
jgi:CDGSH-type Zn-finger protein